MKEVGLTNKKIFLLIFFISFTIYVFTNDGHRFTIDEGIAHDQTQKLISQEPHPDFILGESRIYFDYPEIYPEHLRGRVCYNGVLCSNVNLGHSITEVPFVFINQNLHIIKDDIRWTLDDFKDRHYLLWRNNIDPNLTFLELFYGPMFTALSLGVLFLIGRTFNFSYKNSVIISMLYGFSTIVWPYSQTSLNSVSMVFFILLGYLFFRWFQKNHSCLYLIICGTSLGFAFNLRPDTVIFTSILALLFLFIIKSQKGRIKKIISFSGPIIAFMIFFDWINFVKYQEGMISKMAMSLVSKIENMSMVIDPTTVMSNDSLGITNSLPVAMFGLLFSPGIGLFIFAPILFTSIISFFDFYKKNKFECFFFLGIITIFVVWFAGFWAPWHGLQGWSARYMLPIIPFLLIPLGASLEIRRGKLFFTSLIILGVIGIFFNLSYLVQDVSWYVWGLMGYTDHGLYSISDGAPYHINSMVIWTFEFSQLTHSIFVMLTDLQPDIFLLKVLGWPTYIGISISIVLPLVYYLIKSVRIANYEDSIKK